MPFPTDPRLASYFLPGYPAAIAAAMAAVNAASCSLLSSPCLSTCSPSSLPSVNKSTSSIWGMNPVAAAAAAAGTSFWSTGNNGGGGSSSSSSGYASSEGSGGSSGTNNSNWFHHYSAISPSGGGGLNFSQYPYPPQQNLFNQRHQLRSNEDDLLSCIRRESPSFDRPLYFSNNYNNSSCVENHPIDYNLPGQVSRFSNLHNDPINRDSTNLCWEDDN
ncbi:Transcription factor 7-like 1-A [Schistosoma japonicum]|nr:Transcription factor 7-like 1-A [Schistosoma japonicum]